METIYIYIVNFIIFATRIVSFFRTLYKVAKKSGVKKGKLKNKRRNHNAVI